MATQVRETRGMPRVSGAKKENRRPVVGHELPSSFAWGRSVGSPSLVDDMLGTY